MKGDFSIAQFFTAFREYVEEIDTYPISLDNFVVRDDLYQRAALLLSLSEDEEKGPIIPFASLAFDQPQSSKDLLFSIDLYPNCAVISIGQAPEMYIPYESPNFREKSLAKALVNLAVTLSNGQITMLTTVDNEEPQAIEYLLKQKDAMLYTVVHTIPMFSSKRKSKSAEYATIVKQNSFKIEPKVAYSADIKNLISFTGVSNGPHRQPFDDFDTPLTRDAWRVNMKTYERLQEDMWMGVMTGIPRRLNETLIEKAQRLTAYRHIEVVVMATLFFVMISSAGRLAGLNALLYAAIIFAAVSMLTLQRRLTWVRPFIFAPLAYVAAILFCSQLLQLNEGGFWLWAVAILTLEPILELLIMDPYAIYRYIKRKTVDADSEQG